MRITETKLRQIIREELGLSQDPSEILGVRVRDKAPNPRRVEAMRFGRMVQRGMWWAPEDAVDDTDAVKKLLDRREGWPMWHFEIYRDPETSRLFAEWTVDTSG